MIGLLVVALAEPAAAQHALQRTLTVDPKVGAADFTTIQAAINSPLIAPNSAVKWTVLIYAGTYPESVTLGGTKENIDLVGIDRDAVIIAPTGTGNGITITSGTETSRNNTIRNLTIRTSDGHGIEIVRGAGTPVPADIIIEDCVIEADGVDRRGLLGDDSEDVSVMNCTIRSDNSFGVSTGSLWLIDGCTLATPTGSLTSRDVLVIFNQTDVVVRDCTITSLNVGLSISGPLTRRVLVQGCLIQGRGFGPFAGTLTLLDGTGTIIRDSTIIAQGSDTDTAEAVAVFQDLNVLKDTLVYNCVIRAIGGAATQSVVAYKVDTGTNTHLINCDIRAYYDNERDSGERAEAFALQPNFFNTDISVYNCILRATGGHDREPLVYDIGVADLVQPTGTVRVFGCDFSRWNVPIENAGAVEDTTQRVIGLAVASTTAILNGKPLLPTEQLVTPTSQPDVYRVLSATGNTGIMTQDVIIIGTDFADNLITDVITLAGTVTVSGVKAFRTVVTIIVPPGNPGQTVSVGYTNELGLFTAIAATTDVIEASLRGLATPSSYQVQASIGTVNVNRATVIPPPTVTTGQSYEYVIRAPR